MFNSVAFFIARKYLFSKKSHSVINLISVISIIAVAVPVAAMIIVLSVSNGFSDFAKTLNSTFDPNVKISLNEGVYFHAEEKLIDDIKKIDGVSAVTKYIEDECVIVCGEKNKVVVVRGIESNYRSCFPIEGAIIDGQFNKFNMLMGSGVAYAIGYIYGISGEVTLYATSRSGVSVFGINKSFSMDKISVSGIFMLDVYNDSKYVLVPMEFCQKLLGRSNEISAIGVMVHDLSNLDKISSEIKKLAPDQFVVKDMFQQREVDYAIVQQEKMAIYIILLFIMIIASLTMVVSVIMVMIEKKEQLHIIGILGGSIKLKRLIFRYQSFMMVFIGSLIGGLIGILFVILQQTYGFIEIPIESFLMDSYPVKLIFNDILLVFTAVLIVGYLILTIITRTIVSESRYRDEKSLK